jgi:SpoVK/Ycf46/Vps4 family AAA+-type ATPase
MERAEAPLLPLRGESLKRWKEDMNAYLRQASWKPDRRKAEQHDIDLSFLLQNKALGIEQEDQTSVMAAAVRVAEDRMLLTTTLAFVLNTVRDGLCLGRELAHLYEQASGLEVLMQRNADGQLHHSEQPEFHDKLSVAAAVQLFGTSAYILWRLAEHRAEEVSSVSVDFAGIPEVRMDRPSKALSSAMYYYGAYLERSGSVTGELEFVAITQRYFERLAEEVQLRAASLQYAEFFTNQHYKLEHSDFTVQGFALRAHARVHTVEFNRVEWSDIVANREAKHQFRRYAERLLCYDPETQKNPMLEFGGLPSIAMGDGKPGTGKSMLIAATATYLDDLCKHIGRSFLFWPLPDNIISTYQGGSAERAMDWFRPIQDPGKIVFAPIDDAENNLEARTRRGVSAGVREFIGVFLRQTEGAYSVNYGNKLIGLFTNIPDQIDPAVLSRIQYRVPIEGASNPVDFIDQDQLWWRKYGEWMPGFVNLQDPEGHAYGEAQDPLKHLSAALEAEQNGTNGLKHEAAASSPIQAQQEGVRLAYEAALRKADPDNHRFFGVLYTELQQRYSWFSSRDLRNIQQAIDARVIDVDFPADWLEEPERFFRQNYDRKVDMLRELITANLGGLDFKSLRLQEALRYADNAVRIQTQGLEREIEEQRRALEVRERAASRYRIQQHNDPAPQTEASPDSPKAHS